MSAITHLIAGVPVSDLDAGIDWYTRFFGRPPDMRAGDEILWDVDEHATLFIEPNAATAGAGRITFAVEGLDALIESRRGTWEGMTYADLARDSPALLATFEAGDRSFAFPGGETMEDQIARTRAALAAIAGGPQPALAVAHAGTIRAALTLDGRPVPREREIGHGQVVRLASAP